MIKNLKCSLMCPQNFYDYCGFYLKFDNIDVDYSNLL